MELEEFKLVYDLTDKLILSEDYFSLCISLEKGYTYKYVHADDQKKLENDEENNNGAVEKGASVT